MEWVETTGRTVDDAKEAALDELGVAEEDAEFEVVDEPKQGLFGRLRVEARVRARVRPAAPRPKEDRRRRTRKGREAGSGGRARKGGRGRSKRSAKGSDAPESGSTQPADQGEHPEPAPKAETPTPPQDTPAGPPEDAPTPPAPRRNPARRGRGKGRRRRNPEQAAVSSTTTRPEAGEPKESIVAEETDLRGQAELAESFLSGLVEAFELEGEVTTTFIDDETFEVRVDGDDLGLMIGPKGATLSAVQELTRTAVQRQVTNRTGRILVDIGGYQQRRKDALARFTRQLAEEVISSGTRKILEPMNAADRKVVHDTCNDIEGVRTISEGEDPRRRVVIEPDG